MPVRKTSVVLFTLLIMGTVLCVTGFTDNSKTEDFIPGEDSGFYYTIKKGDTLWDLSNRFYNSTWDWPGLWEMNDEIKNPHWIYPGRIIRIFLKEGATLPPKIVTVTKTGEPVEIDTSFSYSQMDHIAFIKKEAQTSFGTVIKEKEDNIMMSTGDVIFIEPSKSGTLIPGERYHIFTTETVQHEEIGFSGIKHRIKAQIEVLDYQTTYVKAQIIRSFSDVLKGDMVMTYYQRDPVVTVDETPDAIDARLICSENDNLMINDGAIAFIDLGRDQVKPGQIYTVLKKNQYSETTGWPANKNRKIIDLEDLKTGRLIVLHTEDIASTVMIVSSKYAIRPHAMVQ